MRALFQSHLNSSCNSSLPFLNFLALSIQKRSTASGSISGNLSTANDLSVGLESDVKTRTVKTSVGDLDLK